MTRLRSPIWWYGGKGRMTAKLLALMPSHRYYVEPFGGGASLLFAKEPCSVETYNDIDGGLVNFFRVLQDPARFERFHRRVESVPYARQEYDEARRSWEQCDDPIERAARWFIVAKMAFSGRFDQSFSTAVTTSRHGMAGSCSRWIATLCMLPEIHARLMRVQIERSDWRIVLQRYCGEGYLAYLDPPYVHGTRSSTRYAHELSDHDHEQLLDAVLGYDGMVMLSGYPHPLYDRLSRAGWDVRSFEIACDAAGRTRASGIRGAGAALHMQSRTECVWRNPAAMEAIDQRRRKEDGGWQMDFDSRWN